MYLCSRHNYNLTDNMWNFSYLDNILGFCCKYTPMFYNEKKLLQKMLVNVNDMAFLKNGVIHDIFSYYFLFSN